jgi:hypothetical protein
VRTPHPTDAFHATNASRELRTEKARIGRFVRHPADGREPQVDRCGRILSLFEVDSVAEHDSAVERQSRLGAVPGDKLCDRVVVGSLAAGGGQAVQNRRLCLFEIGERQDALGRLPLPGF